MYKSCKEAFPNLVPSRRFKDFIPHLTLGQCKAKEVKDFVAKIQKEWKPVEFICKEIYLICRQGKDDPFAVRKVVHLSGDKTEAYFKVKELPKLQKSKTKLYVGNLAYSMTDKELAEAFESFHIKSAEVITNKFNGKSKGFGFVEFHSEDDLNKALHEMNKKEVKGRTIFLDYAKEMN